MVGRALILVEGHSDNGLRYIAQSLGLHPITLSADPAQYDYLATERVEAIRVDTDNLDALIRECSRLRAAYDIAGTTGFSRADELAYQTAGKLCRYFDLPGPNPTSMNDAATNSLNVSFSRRPRGHSEVTVADCPACHCLCQRLDDRSPGRAWLQVFMPYNGSPSATYRPKGL